MQECIWLLAGIVGSGIYFLFFRCKHQWKEEKFFTTQSKIQHLAQMTNKIEVNVKHADVDGMSARKTITILSCEKCGKINKTIVNH